MTVLSVDPGDSTGWAQWTDDGRMVAHGIDSAQAFMELLAEIPAGAAPKVLVVEKWRLRYHQARQQAGSSMLASQVIGALLLFAMLHDCRVVMQEVEALKIAEMHSGIKMPSDHKKSHDIAAIHHGWYYFECIGMDPVAVLQ